MDYIDRVERPQFHSQALATSCQVAQALAVVNASHPRVAKAIGSFWGFPECQDYLAQLAVDGCVPNGRDACPDFSAAVLSAIRTLQSVHSVNALQE